MGQADGTVVGVTKVLDHGPDAARWNLVLTGDGFRAAEQGAFEAAVAAFVNHLHATPPFDEDAVWKRVNVHRVDVHSSQSGADNPLTCADGTSPTGGAMAVDTFYDAAFCNDGLRRNLQVNDGLVLQTAAAKVPSMHVVVVVVNHVQGGGSGGKVGCYSLHPQGVDIAIHELGHTAFGLADEYEYVKDCGTAQPGQETYTGPEPAEPNVTTVFDKATLKWRHLLSPGHTPPTTANADCTKCPPQTSPVPAATVGAFAGARYFHCGLYRPMFTCKMRDVAAPFCAVCKDAIRTRLASLVPPPVPAPAPAPQVPAPSCFVAGAVYRDPSHADVEQLRRWRDARLAPGARGRLAMRALAAAYARLGPPLARAVERSPRVCGLLRRLLFHPAAESLRRRGRPPGR